MNSKLWIRKALSMCSMVAILATSSMVALAGEAKAAGELIVNGKDVVTVNGEAATSGRTIFTSSVISTPENTGATLNLGTAGQLEVAPQSALVLTFDNNAISVNLSAGSVSVLRASQAVSVNAAGEAMTLVAGESATASAGKMGDDEKDSNGKCVDTDKDGKLECDEGGGNWLLFGAVFAGAIGAVIFGAVAASDRSFGGATTVVSPSR